jgi:membrane-associated phospholipid phosphatase
MTGVGRDIIDWLWGTDGIARVQALGAGWEPFFQVVTYGGSAVVLYSIAAVVAWNSSGRRGTWLLLLLLTSSFVNATLKVLIGLERPHGPDIIPYATSSSDTLPSGHSQGVAALAAGLVLGWRVPLWLVAPPALVVGLSRIYLGVHYPGDVLTGFAIGILLALWLSSPRNRPLSTATTAWWPFALAAVALVTPFLADAAETTRQSAALAGGLIALTGLGRFCPHLPLRSTRARISATLAGLAVLFALIAGVELLGSGQAITVAGYAAAGGWLVAGSLSGLGGEGHAGRSNALSHQRVQQLRQLS